MAAFTLAELYLRIYTVTLLLFVQQQYTQLAALNSVIYTYLCGCIYAEALPYLGSSIIVLTYTMLNCNSHAAAVYEAIHIAAFHWFM